MTRHIVLLGDSVFDNSRYAAPDPDVRGHLLGMLESDGHANARVALLAVDGALTQNVRSQLLEVPQDATHLVLSSGGNDALGSEHLLWEDAAGVSEALLRFEEPVFAFRARYHALVELMHQTDLPIAVCTIYNGDLPQEEARAARLALSLFNDAIYQVATEFGAQVIELRRICIDPADYVNAIEPSGRGGRKIAAAVSEAVGR